MFTSPGNIAIHTPYCTIYWYGIIMAIAFIIGQLVVIQIAKKEYSDKNIVDILYEIVFWALIGGILGARIYYVLLSFPYYSSHLSEIIMLQHGGLSIQGGLLGGMLCVYLYCKKEKIEFLKYADLYALGLPIGQAIGRWGNFFNSEAFGLPTNLPWGLYIPINNRPLMYALNEYFHPTFLYECLWNIIVFLILFFIIKKYFFDKKGVIFFSYLILYSIGRIIIETIRIDSVFTIFNISIAIWVCIATIIISIIALKLIYKKANN